MKNNKLNFIESGTGKRTIVFLHYFGGSANAWLQVIDQLKNNFKCIAIDLCGFGNSPKPQNALSVNDNAEDVIELIQQLKLDKYILVGHSMGGKIALSIAAKKLTGLEFLILVAPSPPTPEPTTPQKSKEMLETFGNRNEVEKLIKKITVNKLPTHLLEETIEDHLKISKIAWDGWIEKGSQEDISDLTANIQLPIKIISGDSDPNFSTDFLKNAFKNFTTASFIEISGTGHLIPIEVPNKLVEAIKESIKKIK